MPARPFSGDSLLRGLLVGMFGLMLAFVSLDPHTGTQRYTFGMLFLWDGVDVITAVLGIFAIPEMLASASRAARSRGAAPSPPLTTSVR